MEGGWISASFEVEMNVGLIIVKACFKSFIPFIVILHMRHIKLSQLILGHRKKDKKHF
jgi:hypothetical protein